MNALTWIEEHRSAAALQRWLQERGAQIVVAILLAAIAIDAAVVLTGLLTRSTAASAPVAAAPPMRPTVNPAVERASVINAHLFGVANTPGADAADAPQTTMPLVLAGVIAAGDPKAGQAIIGANASAAKRYGVGDMIQGGARLTAVYSDRVLIERNGATESLSLPHTSSLPGSPPPQTNNAIVRQPAANLQAGALFNGLLRIQPVFTQGKLSGYRVFPGPRGANVLTQLGLRSGDLITAINGTQLDDATRSMQIVQTLGSADSASVTVSRNGELQELNLNLASISLDAENANSGSDAAATAGQNPGIPPAYRPGGRFGARGGPAPPGAPAAPPEGGVTQGAPSGERPATER